MNTEKGTKQVLSDREFMDQIYQEYIRLMYYTAKQYVSDPRHCDDIIQDSLVRLIKNVSTLRTCNEKAIASYVSITVRNTAINHLRQQKREQAELVSAETGDGIIGDDAHALEEHLMLVEQREQLSKLWHLVDDDVRQLLEGKYILGYDDAQLASLIGCQPSSIRMKLTRARRKAMKILREGNSNDEP